MCNISVPYSTVLPWRLSKSEIYVYRRTTSNLTLQKDLNVKTTTELAQLIFYRRFHQNLLNAHYDPFITIFSRVYNHIPRKKKPIS